MEQSSRPWARRLIVAVLLVVGLLVAALPATAAPTTKKYSASFVGGVNGQVTITSGEPKTVSLRLTNQQDSQQSFGSAEMDFSGSPLPSAVSVSRTGWTVVPLTPEPVTSYRLVSSPTSAAVPPGDFLEVVITMPGTPGTTGVVTRVRQSNDFKGTNNNFTLVNTPPLTIVTAPASTSCEGEADQPGVTCTPEFTSTINKVTADLTITSSAPFTYIARFTTDRLSCDTIPFGPTVKPEPFQMDSTSTSPVSKTLVLTFPKALANLVPNNGTPHHPVCAGGDAPFPGSDSTQGFPPGTFTHPFEGLLLNCSDPDYVSEADDPGILPMCVQSRARNAGKLIVTVLVESTTVDPRVW
jgi:hypothetical protein